MKLLLAQTIISLGDNYFIRRFVLLIYVKIVFQFLKINLKTKFKSITKIFLRHSTLDPESFNAFCSDLDLTIVVDSEDEIHRILAYFLIVKRYLIFLDFPEVLTTGEYTFFLRIEESKYSRFVTTIWHFRKINWLLRQMTKKKSAFELLKYERAIKRSKSYVFKNPQFNINGIVKVSDLLNIDEIIQIPSNDLAMTSYTEYLANNTYHSMKLLLSREQFVVLNALFPLDPVGSVAYPFLSKEFYRVKYLLSLKEYLLSESSIRIRVLFGEDCTEQKNWNNILLEHIMLFNEEDYGNFYVRKNSDQQ